MKEGGGLKNINRSLIDKAPLNNFQRAPLPALLFDFVFFFRLCSSTYPGTPPVQVPSLTVPRRTQPWVGSYRAFQTSARDLGRAGIYFRVCSRGMARLKGCTSMPRIPELLPAQAQIRSGRFPRRQRLSCTKDIQWGEESSLYFRWDH